jgi:hypothetical protein
MSKQFQMKQLSILFFLVISVLASAQEKSILTQTIRGTVVDKVTQSTLPGASIIILNSTPLIGTTTDINGEFKLENIPIGRVSLQVTFIGFEPALARNLLLTSGKELIITIQLEEQAFQMDEVVITAQNNKEDAINEMATASVRTFSVEETERYAGSLGDPSRMASNFAGVAMVNDARNDIIIRGNSPSGLLWRLDGIEIPNPNHFGANGTTGGPVSMLNNNLLTNSDFFTGAFPAEYGNAMSGVFDLKMRTGNNQKHEFVGQVGFNGFELGAEGPFSKNSNSSYMVNYRYSTLGLLNQIGFNFGTGTAVPQYQDLTFKIDLPTKKFGKFTLLGMGGLSYIELHDSKSSVEESGEDSGFDLAGVDLDFRANMGILGLSHLYYFNNDTRLQTIVSVLGTENITAIDSLKFDSDGAIIPSSNFKYYDSKSTEVKYSVASHLRKKVNARNNYTAGVYVDFYNVNYQDSILVDEPGYSGFKSNYGAKGTIPVIRGYFQWQHLLSKKATVNGGVYSQYDQMGEEITVEPRLGLKYKLRPKQTLNFAYGMHSQMQPRYYYFLQVENPDGSYNQSNKNMGLSKSQQFVLGYDFMMTRNLRFKTETYYQHLYDIPVTPTLTEFSMINTGDSFAGFYPDSLENTGTGMNYGIEFTIEKFLSNNYYFLTTISLYESKYKGYSGVERNTAFNGNFVANVLGGYEYAIGKNNSLTIDARVVYAGGKRYVPIDVEASIPANETIYDWDNAYETQYNNYFRTDLRIGFKMNGKKFNQEWAIDLQNLTNSQNLYSEAYNPRTQSLSQKYQTGFFPMFLYRIKF